jgi:hypothetical protein
MSDRPNCGPQPGPIVASPITDIFKLIGIGSTIGSVIGVAVKAVEIAGFAFGGLGGVGIAGVAGAFAVFLVCGYMLFNRCAPRDGGIRCWAGVVNGITESFSSGWDYVFPSGAMHPRVDVVVKPSFWDITAQNAATVACSPVPAGLGSPMIQTFYKSAAVCGAGAGALLGAAVGVGAAVATAVAIGAIGCATIIFCLLALLIALIVGAIMALAGASIGGNIGHAIAGDDSPHATSGIDISVGDLISVNGRLITMEEFDSANIGWWGQGTTIHGRVPTPAPYSDAEAAQLLEDTCRLPDPPREPKDDPDPPQDPPK